jgi:hypothetical protein
VKQNSIGSVTAVSPSPLDPNRLVYATGGRLYHSTDGGLSATVAANLGGGTTIYAFARPRAVPTTIFAAGGTGSVGHIYKSTDDGVTWTTVYTQEGSRFGATTWVLAIAADGSNPAHVIAGVSVYHGGFVVASTDGGASWTRLPSPPLRLRWCHS